MFVLIRAVLAMAYLVLGGILVEQVFKGIRAVFKGSKAAAEIVNEKVDELKKQREARAKEAFVKACQ